MRKRKIGHFLMSQITQRTNPKTAIVYLEIFLGNS